MENKKESFRGWFRFLSNANATLIFVHGFLSNSRSCWEGKAFWPELVAADPRLAGLNLYLAEYHTSPSSGLYDLSQCAQELRSQLAIPDADGNPPPIAGNQLVFVCHSMGGIVARELLESYSHIFKDKRVGLVLMASPSTGSSYANLAAPIFRIWQNRQLKLLRNGDQSLTDLDRRFKRLVHERRIPTLIGTEACEHRLLRFAPIISRFLGSVVKIDSASRYFGEPRVLPCTTHGSIVKPTDIGHASHQFLVEFLLGSYGYVPGQSPMLPIPVDSKQKNLLPKVLFDSLDESSIEYYFHRAEDRRLAAALSMYSVWISGPSGVGKTSAARAYLIKNGLKPIEICLSPYAGNLSHERCIDEIASTIEQRSGIEPNRLARTERAVAVELAKLAAISPVVLYFDEVPLARQDTDESLSFCSFVVRLLNLIKDETGNPDLRIMISSISPPLLPKEAGDKILERLKIFDLTAWDQKDLEGLFNLINTSLQPIIAGCGEDATGIDSGNLGSSPRELKTMLREHVYRLQSGAADLK